MVRSPYQLIMMREKFDTFARIITVLDHVLKANAVRLVFEFALGDPSPRKRSRFVT